MLKERIIAYQGDITKMGVDAIVNAANPSLLGGGGVDGAIHHAAGPELKEECRLLHGCPIGQAKLTKGYKLPAPYVIHTVGPIWRGGNHDENRLLQACYVNSLFLAVEHGLTTIAFPAISTGAYGYPPKEAAQAAVEAVAAFLRNNSTIEKVYLVGFNKESYELYQQTIAELTE